MAQTRPCAASLFNSFRGHRETHPDARPLRKPSHLDHYLPQITLRESRPYHIGGKAQTFDRRQPRLNSLYRFMITNRRIQATRLAPLWIDPKMQVKLPSPRPDLAHEIPISRRDSCSLHKPTTRRASDTDSLSSVRRLKAWERPTRS